LFLKEKTCFRQYRLLIFVNILLHNLLLFNLSVLLFLSLLKKLTINCLDKNTDKIENTNRKTNLKIFKNKDLYWTTKTLLKYSKATIELENFRFRILLK